MSLKVEVIQLNVVQGEFQENLIAIETYVKQKKSDTKLLVFPQYAITGYPTLKILNLLNSEHDNLIKQICEIARKYKVGLLFSIPKNVEKNSFQDCICYVNENGTIETTYIRINKFWREDNCITGKEIKIINIDNIKIGIMAGDDIYYPEISRQLAQNEVSCIICLFYNAKRKLSGNNFDLADILKSLVMASAVINEVDFLLCSANGTIDQDDNQSIIAGSVLVGNSMIISLSEPKEINIGNNENSFTSIIDENKINFYRMINRRNQQ
ncbi:MAG: carbon-nitrogen hydrolase family protein [Oscillospiraceae bacterium]|nr:carbon-nitrogen hydrolase family protein [Oscillospiraceae bacterium]